LLEIGDQARRQYDRVITDGIHSGIVGKIRNERLQQSSHAIGDTITSTTKPLEQISNSGEWLYRELIDVLMYLAITTRPDIANTMSRLT